MASAEGHLKGDHLVTEGLPVHLENFQRLAAFVKVSETPPEGI